MSVDFLQDKSILVTGGTGSFGQFFVRLLLEKTRARRVIVFSRDELKQSQMAAVLPDPAERLRFFIGDIRDISRLQRAFHGVDYVVHAAALKQVPALEYNPFEAVQTNIIGTQNVISAAIDQGVQKVIFVSTDKAANPANLYGATKLCAERLIIAGNAYAGGASHLSVVRYGNVFGSRGSIVKVIAAQRASGEVTLTHEDMTRFWITLGQGAALVLSALERMHGGEVFVPKIPSMRVKDFITTLAPDCRIKVIGIRPGEKLHEVLVTPEEARHTREYATHYVIMPRHAWFPADRYADGQPVPDGFYFASNNNKDWMPAERLRELMTTV